MSRHPIQRATDELMLRLAYASRQRQLVQLRHAQARHAAADLVAVGRSSTARVELKAAG